MKNKKLLFILLILLLVFIGTACGPEGPKKIFLEKEKMFVVPSEYRITQLVTPIIIDGGKYLMALDDNVVKTGCYAIRMSDFIERWDGTLTYLGPDREECK